MSIPTRIFITILTFTLGLNFIPLLTCTFNLDAFLIRIFVGFPTDWWTRAALLFILFRGGLVHIAVVP